MRDDKPTERPRGAARILGWAVNGGGVIAAGATLILMVHIIVDVAMRYLANAPLPGTIEVVSYWWMVLIIFPAVALTQPAVKTALAVLRAAAKEGRNVMDPSIACPRASDSCWA